MAVHKINMQNPVAIFYDNNKPWKQPICNASKQQQTLKTHLTKVAENFYNEKFIF